LPKYRYPSAGDLYPVQVYLYVKPECIEGLAGGTYYYHPSKHELLRLSSEARLDRDLHAAHNRAIFDESAFSLFLVGQLNAIAPLYGEQSRDFCLLEAGYLGQLLMTAAPAAGLGLCPIGGLDFERVRPWLALDTGHEPLHSLLGGCPAETAVGPFASQPSLDAELASFLRTKLPEYMVPSAFVLLERLPLTPNGKIDRAALPAPAAPRATEGPSVSPAPESDIEGLLSGIIQEVLETTTVGLTDNFFDLGATSLHIVRMHRRLTEVLQRDIAVVEMFKHPSIRSLAEHLTGGPTASAAWQQGQERAAARRASRNRHNAEHPGESS